MIRAVLFDLDGTLLSNDIHSFLPPYFELLTGALSDLVPPKMVVQEVMAATRAMMVQRESACTNQEVFFNRFLPAIGLSWEQALARFDAFYEHDFGKLRKYTERRPEARPTMAQAFKLGFQVVIATNAVFPLRAIEHRLDWAGVGDFPYALITSYENMHACKPNPAYYLEIAHRLGRQPGECLMIGNDPDDLAAAQTGMATFYVTYGHPEGRPLPQADHAGTLVDLQRLLSSFAPRQ